VTRVKLAEPVSTFPSSREKDPKLQLYVVFTDLEATRAALMAASQLARDLRASLVLLAAIVVPYPLPLEGPAVTESFTNRMLSRLAAEPAADVSVRVLLCRDRNETIRDHLRPESLVVIGRRKRWWPDGTYVLARLLRRAGHEVVLAGAGRTQPFRVTPVNVESSL
jgi:hypothetical protein